jgi:hypothetical protein
MAGAGAVAANTAAAVPSRTAREREVFMATPSLS